MITGARTYAHQHGGLGGAHYHVEHDGFPLGWWLYEQRKRANAHLKRTGQPWPHQAAMTTIDPWWNPPWRATWQHTYTRIQDHPDPARPQPRPHTRTSTIQNARMTWSDRSINPIAVADQRGGNSCDARLGSP
ncbi:helicase associated domain-containing protein [Kitasatospora indigofera]|uniref:helicase associated domain-containing protein n=1 Tax=Kitasatospora indigofera TaxID=67307 RepID=UPI00367DB2A8